MYTGLRYHSNCKFSRFALRYCTLNVQLGMLQRHNRGQLYTFRVLEGTKSPVQKASLIKNIVTDSCMFFVNLCRNVRASAANSGPSGLFVLEESGLHRHTLCVHRRGKMEIKASKGELNAS